MIGVLLPGACSDNGLEPEPLYGPVPEYGAPHATVILDGVVVDGTGDPIRDIAVELDGFGGTTSDSLGRWSLNRVGYSSCLTDSLVGCGLEATDVDSTENGGPYLPELVILDLDKTQDGSGYNLGTFEQHNIRIEMDETAVLYGPQCAAAARKRQESEED